jgi:hypothetical protein
MTEQVRLQWGHEVFAPNGERVRLPVTAVFTLRRLGMLKKNRSLGGLQISESLAELLTPEYDAIAGNLRRTLGTDMTGPEWLVCNCRSCKRNRDEALELLKEKCFDFMTEMAVQRNAR